MDFVDPGGAQPVFFQSSILEPRGKDEHERKLEKYLQTISKLSSGLSERESIDAFNLHISKGNYEEVQLGLLSMILTSSSQAARSFNSLTMTNRDNLKCVRDCLFNFTSKWRRLTDVTQQQIVWFTGELLRLGPNPVILDLVMLLFRNIAPGDISSRNVWLAESMLRIFIEHRQALDRQPFLVDCIVYCYLSIVVDHCHPSVSPNLRKMEIDFTVSLLRDKWDECCNIGRDLIRLLHGVARIPEFESIWYDVLHQPQNLSPQFQGLVPLLRRRTSRRFLLLRITPDLEQKFFFVTSKVRMAGPYLRHLEWLKKSIIQSHGPTLRCELIRYICGLIHPTMETINSDVIQRWYIIGWLLKCHPTAPPGDIALAKLAIYFDWLGFDPAQDNVMNIEPGVLLIYHSKQQMGNMGSVLLDFLCRLAVSFHPPASDEIRLGMLTAFKHLQEKRVVPLQSIGQLFDPRHLEQDVFFLCRQTFPELLPQQQTAVQPHQVTQTTIQHIQPPMTKFSDDDDEDSGHVSDAPTMSASDSLPYKPFTFIDEQDSIEDLEQSMASLGNEELALLIRQIAVASDAENEQKSSHVEEVIRKYQSLLDSEDQVQDLISALPQCLLNALRSSLIKSPLPSLTCSQDQLEESLASAHFVLFHSILSSSLDEDDPARSSLVSLVANMAAKQGRVLLHFIYFLAVKQQDSSLTKVESEQLLRELIKASPAKPSIEQFLMGALEFAQQVDSQLFVYFLPFLFTNFKSVLFDPESASLVRILKLTCQVADSKQLAYLTAHILLRQLTFFSDSNACSLLTASLQWETLEQLIAWQLYFAHSSIQPQRLIPIVSKLKPDKHHEALISLCNRFSMLPPGVELVGSILSRSPSSSEFVSPALLKSWADQNPNMLIESLNQLLNAGQQAQKAQMKVGAKVPPPPPISKFQGGLSRDQLLAHLDRFRLVAQDHRFLLYPPVQRLLQTVHQTATEHMKNKYADLFGLIDEKLASGATEASSSSASASTSTPIVIGGHFDHRISSSSGVGSHNNTLIADLLPSPITSASSVSANSHSSGASPLSALSLLDSVDGGLPRLSSASSVPVSSSSGVSKLRRVQKRSPSQTGAGGSSSTGGGGGGGGGPPLSNAPKMAKFAIID